MAPIRGFQDQSSSYLRIVGGKLRGSKILYQGDPRTRPMKERVREALFNLLGPSVLDKHAVDLFAGTGALALEAISRGAQGATMIERHFPTTKLIRKNVEAYQLEEKTEIIASDTFFWGRQLSKDPSRLPHDAPWVVFFSPPYDFYIDRADDMLALIETMLELAPAESIFAVEADERFDFETLPDPLDWDVREYPPATIGVRRH